MRFVGSTSEERGVPGRVCGAVHEGCLLQCDLCGMHFRRRQYLEVHVVMFMKGSCYIVMFGRRAAELRTTLKSI